MQQVTTVWLDDFKRVKSISLNCTYRGNCERKFQVVICEKELFPFQQFKFSSLLLNQNPLDDVLGAWDDPPPPSRRKFAKHLFQNAIKHKPLNLFKHLGILENHIRVVPWILVDLFLVKSLIWTLKNWNKI